MLKNNVIIHEEKDFLVINKPTGVSVHGGEKVRGEILADFLVSLYPELKAVGDMPHVRPGIVHRLDKETSGVMIVARTHNAFEELKKTFMERRVYKRYTGLVCGVIKKDFWEMKTIIGRSKKRYTKQVSLSVSADDERVEEIIKEGKEAITEFEVMERLQGRYTLISAYPKTGRMHQIRVQLASFGFPLVCDRLYCTKKTCCPKSVGRLFLHAETIRFPLFGKEHEFYAELPKELEGFLKKIRVAKK